MRLQRHPLYAPHTWRGGGTGSNLPPEPSSPQGPPLCQISSWSDKPFGFLKRTNRQTHTHTHCPLCIRRRSPILISCVDSWTFKLKYTQIESLLIHLTLFAILFHNNSIKKDLAIDLNFTSFRDCVVGCQLELVVYLHWTSGWFIPLTSSQTIHDSDKNEMKNYLLVVSDRLQLFTFWSLSILFILYLSFLYHCI